jgi:poly-gamma-glutamate synthesis protein (capsule biosynthesis protein)
LVPSPRPLPTNAPAPGTSAAPTTEPLVLAINATRVAQNVDLPTARAIAAGTTKAWRSFKVVETVAEVLRDPSALTVVAASKVGPEIRPVTVGGVDPFREPDRYPLKAAGPAPAGPAVDVTFGGDVMLGRRVATAATRAGDPSAPLRAIGPRLASADLTVVNLESTLSRAGSPQQGNDSFAAPPAVVTGLRDAGVDVLSLANNHTGDYETDALLETVERVRAGGIQPVGAGSNISEAIKPAVVSRSGLRFGFLAFNAIGETPRATSTAPGAFSVRMPPRTGPLNQSDLAVLTSAIGSLRTQVDVVVVLAHWGQQYTHNPVAAQRTVGAALAEAGADLVIGGHPHWVQAVEYLPNKVIAHSLGNLVFDMDFSQQTREGVLLEVTYWGKTLKAARLTPYLIDGDFTPRLVGGNRADQILADIRNAG